MRPNKRLKLTGARNQGRIALPRRPALFICRSTTLRPPLLRPQLKRDPLGSVMRLLARSHVFIVLAALVLAMFPIGQYWRQPFHDDAQGFARAFGSAWQVVFLPIQLMMGLVWAAGGTPTRIVAGLALIIYLAAFVGLDVLIARIARTPPSDAA